ncbi:MAG: arsenosugar biosynthesis radical SAM (seleno)protein ArsS [Suipraeoptans sp.]
MQKNVPEFESLINDEEIKYTADSLSILQMNLGRLCNLACKHCHVSAGPNRTEIMSKDVMQACLNVYEKYGLSTIDITGGAPEMNPHFKWLVEEASKICSHVIVRTNLVILEEEGYSNYIDMYKKNKVEIVCSLPYYEADTMDRVRGANTFDSAIRVLGKLNEVGYGIEAGLTLNLVYNPAGAFFPPPQEAMEAEYKAKLKDKYGIEFNSLFTIMNNPIGRFGDFLKRSNNYDGYMVKLYEAFNADTLESMMCRSQISVGYDGRVYDCDFNQGVHKEILSGKTIFDLEKEDYTKRKIYFANHCYACTAGQGSSCGGATQ